MNRQKLLLAALAAVFALALIWSYATMPRPKSVGALKYPPGGGTASPGTSAAPRPPVDAGASNLLRLDLLDRGGNEFHGYRRNIFKPVFTDETKLAEMRLTAAKHRPAPPPPPPPAMPPQPAVTENPRVELPKFTFLGFLQKEKRKIVFLSRDKQIILVRKGDIFGGRFEATSITDQSLVIKVTDSGEEIVIPLVEHASLRPAR